jgi:hypothetical protein
MIASVNRSAGVPVTLMPTSMSRSAGIRVGPSCQLQAVETPLSPWPLFLFRRAFVC